MFMTGGVLVMCVLVYVRAVDVDEMIECEGGIEVGALVRYGCLLYVMAME